jgi:iron complex outermembrane receptor protein
VDVAKKNYYADWGQSHNLDTTGAPFSPLDPTALAATPANGYPAFDRTTPLEQRAYSIGAFQNITYSSVYVQDELGFFKNKLRLTLAGRYTDLKQSYYGDTKAQHFTPRIGLSVSPMKSMAVYALYDQAFIPQAGVLSNGNKVQPITGNNMEVGIKKDWLDGKWNTTVAVYQIVKKNEITADPYAAPLSGLSVELGEKTAQGIEFDLRGTIFKGFDLIANYAYTDSRITKVTEGVPMKVGTRVPPFAKHTVNGWITYKIPTGVLKGFGATAGCTWLAGRATYWEESPAGGDELADYFKLDAGLFWEKNKFKISGNMFNVLDAYLYSGSYYGSYFSTPVYSYQVEAPRNVRMSVAYKF